jgi:hypothetical protein
MLLDELNSLLMNNLLTMPIQMANDDTQLLFLENELGFLMEKILSNMQEVDIQPVTLIEVSGSKKSLLP